MEKAMGKAPMVLGDSSPSSDSSSNVTATTDHGDTAGAGKQLVLSHEAAKGKMNMDEKVGGTSGAADASLLLDLTVLTAGSGDNKPLSSNKAAVIKESSSLDDGAHDEPPPTNRVFKCNHCTKSFVTSPVLSGHQNAHRRKRLIAKRQQEVAAMIGYRPPSTLTYGCGSFNVPYSNVPRFPALGRLNKLAPRGVRMDQPMVHKLQPAGSQRGSAVVQNEPWPVHAPLMASPPPRMKGMPRVPNNSSNNFNNGGFVGQFRAPPPPAFNLPQQGGSSMMHSFQAPSRILCPNVRMSRVGDRGCGAGGGSGRDPHVLLGKRDDQPNTHHGGLDLTLKL